MRKRGIDIISGFNVKSEDPIDNRFVCNTLEEMNNMENAYDGLICYNKEDKTFYARQYGVFSEWKGGGNNAFTYTFSLQLAGDKNSEESYLIRK